MTGIKENYEYTIIDNPRWIKKLDNLEAKLNWDNSLLWILLPNEITKESW